MNCEDISRIADTGSFGALTEAERREAAAHALTCRRCAVVWSAHLQLAALVTPPMPEEVPLRLQALAGLPAQSQRRYPLRRLTVIGGLVALAAAAGVLTWRLDGSTSPTSPPAASRIAPEYGACRRA